ncbi:MAG: homoserine O-succinyltransferase [Lachnospiraceae bacterium]|nr:homoserine O-succinyltransferase [Lachnospiraceae bacterium]
MPIKVKNNLPAKKIMEQENIFMMDEIRANTQDIRPLEIAILNLMPLKEDTEVQFLRSLSNTPLQLRLTFLTTATYHGKNTPASHLDEFYKTFEDVKDSTFDGLIITGAPVETLEFEEVQYWDELCKIMDWAEENVTSTLCICWGAQAALYHYFDVKKYQFDKKLFGLYDHTIVHRKIPFVRGFDDVFLAPHSRYTGASHEDIVKAYDRGLRVLVESEECGDVMLMSEDGSKFFVMCHLEYDRLTLDQEYKRDAAKGLDTAIPVNYYKDDNPENKPLLRWRAHCDLMYMNWLNYYVYQETPYELNKIKKFRNK